MTQTIVNLGTGGAALNGRNGSTTGADSNDALFLAPEDTGYAYLPGVAGNFLSVPDEAALDITGDIDIRVQVALADWTPTATVVIYGSGVGVNQTHEIQVITTGAVRFVYYDGVTSYTKTSTAAPTIADNASLWIKVTLDVDNGASGHDVKFWTSNDNVVYTQLGATVTTAGVIAVAVSASERTIGARSNGSPTRGKVYRAVIYSDLTETTKVLDVDCDAITSGSQTSFTAVTGQTVTINRSTSGRKTVAVPSLLNGGSPVWLFGTDDYMEVADNALLNFGAGDSFTVVAVVRDWHWNSHVYVSKTTSFSNAANQGYVLYSISTPGVVLYIKDGAIAAGDQSNTGAKGSLTTFAGVRNTTSDLLSAYANEIVIAPVSDTTTGSLTNSQHFRIGRLSGAGTGYADMELYAVAVFRRALTATEISAITTYYQARVS